MKQLERFRIFRKLTRKQLSEKTGIKMEIINRIEKGLYIPTQSQLKNIMNILNVDFKTLNKS